MKYYTTDPGAKGRFIRALRELADYLDRNPAIPVPKTGETVTLYASSAPTGCALAVSPLPPRSCGDVGSAWPTCTAPISPSPDARSPPPSSPPSARPWPPGAPAPPAGPRSPTAYRAQPACATTARTETTDDIPGLPRSLRRQEAVDIKRRYRIVENDEYAAFLRRVIRAYSRRVAAGDVEAIAAMNRLTVDLEEATRQAITGLRRFGYSWADIAMRLGITRQGAQQRWGETPEPVTDTSSSRADGGCP
jgi:hypothetical protein